MVSGDTNRLYTVITGAAYKLTIRTELSSCIVCMEKTATEIYC